MSAFNHRPSCQLWLPLSQANAFLPFINERSLPTAVVRFGERPARARLRARFPVAITFYSLFVVDRNCYLAGFLRIQRNLSKERFNVAVRSLVELAVCLRPLESDRNVNALSFDFATPG